MLIDTHCHLDFDRYDEDRAQVLERAAEAGVGAIINPGTSLETSAAACALAAEYDLVFAAVGLHPNSTADYSSKHLDHVRDLSTLQKVVAIGEIGLDYYWDRSPKETQWRAFEAQLALAAERNLPVIIHNREATEDTLTVLETWVAGLDGSLREHPGVLHSFSMPSADLERVVALGFYIGITGPVTFKKADDLRRVVAAAPEDRLLIETDGPFLTPHPYRGKRNEPAYVRYVAERIATVRLTSIEAISEQTTANAKRFFGIAP